MLTGDRAERYLQRLATDYRFFIAELWKDRGLDKVAPLGDVELDIADWAANGPRLRGILAPRGVGKTHLVTASLTLYRGLRDPDRKIIIPSKSLDAAKKTVHLIREWIDKVWFFRHLTPRRDQRDASTYIDFGPAKEDRQSSVVAIGIDGQLENNRAHSIFPDDVETKGNTKTLEAREELDRIVKEFTNILYPFRPFDQGGPIDPPETVYAGTIKHEETLYSKLARRGYSFRTWTLAYPAPDEKTLNLAPMIRDRLDSGTALPGQPTMPHRFDEANIIQKQAEGRTEYAMEHMLVIDLAEANRYPLHLSDLIVMPVDRDKAPLSVAWGTQNHKGSTVLQDLPCIGFGHDRLHAPVFIEEQWAPFTGTKMWIDSAGRGADMTGVAVVSHLNGFLWTKIVQGLEGGYSPDALDRLAELARTHRVREIYVEDNFGGGMFAELLAPVLRALSLKPGQSPEHPDGWIAAIIDDTKITHATGQKETRIIGTLEPVLSTHRMIVDPACLRPAGGEIENDIQYQISRITRQRGCLREYGAVDAWAGCVKAWQFVLNRDPARGVDAARQRRLDEAIREQNLNAGTRSQPPRWFQRT